MWSKYTKIQNKDARKGLTRKEEWRKKLETKATGYRSFYGDKKFSKEKISTIIMNKQTLRFLLYDSDKMYEKVKNGEKYLGKRIEISPKGNLSY